MAYDDDPGFLTETFSSPWVSVPYIIASGLASGANPYTGIPGLARGANAALGGMLGLEAQNRRRRDKERLSKSLGTLADTSVPVTSTKTGMNPATTTFELPTPDPNQRMSQVLPGDRPLAPPAPMPTYQTTEQKPLFTAPQREYLKAIGAADPGAVIRAMGSTLFKETGKPTVVGKGGTLVDDSGNVIYRSPTEVKEPVWKPYQLDLGDRVETGMISSQGEKRIDQIIPKGAAPTKPVSPEEQARINSATALNNARIRQLNSAIEIAKGAKRATVGQLAQALNALNSVFDEDDATKALVQSAKTAVLRELAVRKTAASGESPRPSGEAATGLAKPGTAFNSLPDAAKYKGRTVTNTDTGEKLQSDGVYWRDSSGQIAPANLDRRPEY